MIGSWSELRAGAAALADGFDAAVWAPADAARLLVDVVAVKNIAATVEGALAARVAESGEWRHAGATSAEQHVAKLTGVTAAHAAGVIETARQLADLPETAAAAARGELSPQQASLVAAAASLNPEAEGHLLSHAGRLSVGELRTECARVKATVEDLDARHARIHAKRSCRHWTDVDGTGHLHYTDNVERLATIMAALGARRDRLFTAARREGRRDGLDAYTADALFEMASDDGTWAGPNRKQRRAFAHAKVIARIDAPALISGHVAEGEVCEIVGYGPVPVSVIREMLEKGGAFAAAVLTHGKNVITVAHLGRRANAFQQTALEWMDPLCAVEGCNNVARLQIDHRVDWAHTHFTALALLDRLCPMHHKLKTLHGWALVAGRGKRAFVAPDDPRHPNNNTDADGPTDPAGINNGEARLSAAALVEELRAKAHAERSRRQDKGTSRRSTDGHRTNTDAEAALRGPVAGNASIPGVTGQEQQLSNPTGVAICLERGQMALVSDAGNGHDLAVAPQHDGVHKVVLRGRAAPEPADNDPPDP